MEFHLFLIYGSQLSFEDVWLIHVGVCFIYLCILLPLSLTMTASYFNQVALATLIDTNKKIPKIHKQHFHCYANLVRPASFRIVNGLQKLGS